MKWVPIKDDGCRWILREGHEPFAVLPCDRCEDPVVVFEEGVRCLRCGKVLERSAGEDFYSMLARWNEATGAGLRTRADVAGNL